MRVALTGASGFIGAAIAGRLREAGHTVTALVRPTSRRDHIEPLVDRFVEGDQADGSAWPALLDGADAVVHNSVDWAALREADPARHLASNLVGSIGLLHASAPRPFVFMSTIAVHHDMSPSWEGRIDDEHPLRPGGRYGAYKAAVEPHLWAAHAETGRHTAAIRPCAVYGIDPSPERSHGFSLVEKIRRGENIDKPGGGKFVHVDDVASATVAALTTPDAAGRPFNLVDCYARWADWGLMARELLGAGVEVDTSSPPEPKNTFTKDHLRVLGLGPPFLERGHGGIREHLRRLIEEMERRA